jgi:hypothetical protein
MTIKTYDTQQNLLAAGGQGSAKSGLITCTQIGKNCAVPSLHRDSFPAKVPGLCPVLSSGNTTSPYCRAVMFKPPGDFNHDKFNWTMA